MKNLKSKKGITLVALIITIIILLILAGITISQLQNNGLFDKSKTAKEKWEVAQSDEDEEIEKYTNEINSYLVGNREYKPISYSTEEQDTGLKWINGKTIYQKTMPISGTTGNDVWTNVGAVKPANVEKIISFHTTAACDTLIYWNASNLYAASRGGTTLTNEYLTIQYTKTTD